MEPETGGPLAERYGLGRWGRVDGRRNRRRAPWALLFVALSMVAHVVMLGVASKYLPTPFQGHRDDKRMNLVILEPPPEPEEELPPEPEPPKYEGQIVEIAPPEVELAPQDAEYLSEYDNTVVDETRSERYEVNPEVLAKEFSKEQHAEQADVVDLNVEKPSTGATVGNHRFDPNVDGALAALPSPWLTTNKEGPQDPIPSSQRQAMLSGAPQNDRLDEAVGKVVDLNTTKYPYAGYMDRIRRQVNYWWEQNLDNLPSSVRLARSSYTTDVSVILNADGALESIVITDESGSIELDDCVVRAFRLAAPFANPPEALVQKDGRVYLPDFDYTVRLSAAQMQYEGIDPRAGVQFPGILKSPR